MSACGASAGLISSFCGGTANHHCDRREHHHFCRKAKSSFARQGKHHYRLTFGVKRRVFAEIQKTGFGI
ncbi:MAG: hypothetical protein J5879_07650 [Clostridia bacterium]|nr:hypothetical protein [Clostridia bacterium]